jgi:hypothetical protein
VVFDLRRTHAIHSPAPVCHCLEVSSPARSHVLAAANGLPERIDEYVILGHVPGQSFHVVLIDEIQKNQNYIDRGCVGTFHLVPRQSYGGTRTRCGLGIGAAIFSGLRTNAVCYGPFIKAAARQPEIE